MKNKGVIFGVIVLVAVVLGVTLTRNKSAAPTDKSDIVVGLVAAQSGAGALSGEAIQRGIEAAVTEINADGGLLGGRKLRLVVRDDEGNPSKGAASARELINNEKAVAIFGGFHSPVSLAMLEVFHETKTPYVGTWAAATAIIQNGKNPNYMFRVSACDDNVDEMLVRYGASKFKATKFGLILEKTPWGESNEAGLKKHLEKMGLKPVGTEWFKWEDPDMTPQLLRLRDAGADCLIMIANAQDGSTITRGLAKIAWDAKIISHWGVAGGRFPELAGAETAAKVPFLQTYSFIGKTTPAATKLTKYLLTKYNLKDASAILVPSGVANAYDAMHLLAEGIKTAGTTDGPALRDGLEKINRHDGLIKNYVQPFANDHEALDPSDYIMAKWQDGKIVPAN